MASKDHAQSEGPGPATTTATTDSISTAPASSQPIPASTLEVSDSAITTSPAAAPQDTPVTDLPDTTTTDQADSTTSAPPQPSTTEPAPTTTLSSETDEQKALAAPVPELSPETSAVKEPEESGPSLTIVLLLITGTRHPFKIDADYLRKRDVSVENNDPFAMSVYTLKELIWRAWQEDWEPRPSSPSSIRLISFGKLLDDKSPLSDSKFSQDAPNVVHMTVKPQEIVDEEDAKGTKTQYSRDREASERSPRCRCVIQ
ncbi:ubiquitin-related domain-containing protein [Aspergillus pseudoustus]|uniref:Ubiquitin-related domain-containing protein n=1 Tax=Aspergillus pseudoustus TaxID=1810923 RepID=A0ABR4IZC4_9EURO